MARARGARGRAVLTGGPTRTDGAAVENFVQLCNENPLLDPKGALMSIHWITSMTTRLQSLASDAGSVKDGLIFFDRSPITPHVCAPAAPAPPAEMGLTAPAPPLLCALCPAVPPSACVANRHPVTPEARA